MNEPPTNAASEPRPENAALGEQPTLGEPHSNLQPAIFGIVAWMVPGLGHVFLRRWKKATAFFGVVVALIILGCAMRGDVFAPGSDGPVGTLGFFAEIGSGALYFLARAMESPRVDLSTAAGDYGTRFIAAAGIVNVLAVIDAFQTAAQRGINRCN